MRITRHSLAAVIGIVVLAGGLAFAQAGDPLVGTWKLNTGKSKGTMFKSGTTAVEKGRPEPSAEEIDLELAGGQA